MVITDFEETLADVILGPHSDLAAVFVPSESPRRLALLAWAHPFPCNALQSHFFLSPLMRCSRQNI
jgi:hypothetical protein